MVVRLVTACLAMLLWASAACADAALKEEAGFLRIRLNERGIRLESLIVKPEAAQGRLPLAVFTHGKSPSSVMMADLKSRNYAWLARDLARRGWIAAIVLRRGFGQSDSRSPPYPDCSDASFAGKLGQEIGELEATLATLRSRPDVDPDRIIVIGESAGGLVTLGLAQNRPAGLRGIVNLAGGLRLDECEEKSREALVSTIGAWQKPDTPPQLWVYARNDTLFPPALVERMRMAALDAGDDVRFVELPEIKPNGHLIVGNTPARFIWMKELDVSLRAWNLPTWSPAEMRRIFASLKLDSGFDSYDRYFSAPGEKAMAVSRAQRVFRYRFAETSLDVAKERALKNCAEKATDCVIAFENGRFMLEQPQKSVSPEAAGQPRP